MAALQGKGGSHHKSSSESSISSLDLENLLDEGLSTPDVLARLDKTGDKAVEKLCLSLVRDRELKKQARFRRFGSVAHLRPGYTKGDQYEEEWKAKKRPTPNVQWHFDRDTTIEERLNAALPVGREKPIMAAPPLPTSGFGHGGFATGRGYKSRGHGPLRGGPAYDHAVWVNPNLPDDDTESTFSTPTFVSNMYRIDKGDSFE